MDYENIKKLIDDMGSSKLSSLQIDFPDGTKISMKKENDCNAEFMEFKPNKSMDNDICINQNEICNKIIDLKNDNNQDESVYKYIKSPMVGTFYSKPSPDEKSYIEVGEKIKKGDTTCIIEAMKLMNEIETEFDGEVVEILKKDGEPVEYGENLIKLK